MLHLDAWVRLKRWCDGFERGVELGDARLGQQVHQVKAGEKCLVLGVRQDEFVVEVYGFDLRNVSLKSVHVPHFKAKECAQLERVQNNLCFLREARGRGGGGRRSE